MVRPTAIVPVRTGPTAKRRLAHVLSPDDRHALMRDLLDHVVSVLTACGLRVIVLSPDTEAERPGTERWPDDGPSLNAAVDAAVARASTPALVVHADLPFVAVDDVEALLDERTDVVIARARDGGTNALLLREPMRCAFGPRSALAHALRARRAGLGARVIDRPGLALDVDDEASLIASARRAP